MPPMDRSSAVQPPNPSPFPSMEAVLVHRLDKVLMPPQNPCRHPQAGPAAAPPAPTNHRRTPPGTPMGKGPITGMRGPSSEEYQGRRGSHRVVFWHDRAAYASPSHHPATCIVPSRHDQRLLHASLNNSRQHHKANNPCASRCAWVVFSIRTSGDGLTDGGV